MDDPRPAQFDEPSPSPAAAQLRWLTLAGILAILLVRNWDAYRYPVLFGEDGSHLFTFFLEHREFHAILRSYAGYVSIGPNLFGWGVGFAPLLWQPYLLVMVAGALHGLAFWLFTSDRFAGILPSLPLRCLCAGLLALLPVGNFALMTCTMFGNWSMLLIAYLLAVAAPPRPGWRRHLEFVALWLCLWSNPVSVLLVPVYGWRIWSAEDLGDRRYFAALGLVAVLYPLLLVEPRGGAADLGAVFRGVATLLVERVFTEPLVGTVHRAALREWGWSLLPAVAVVVCFSLLLRRMPSRRRAVVLMLGYLCLATTGLSAYARSEALDGMLQWGHRYTYLPKLLLFLALMIAILTAMERRGASRRTFALAAVLLVVHGLGLSLANQFYYDTSPRKGQRIMAFCARADAWRRTEASRGEEMVYTEPRFRLVVPGGG